MSAAVKLKIKPRKDFLERIAATKPITAISELIWNGLDAGAEKIEVEIHENSMGGIKKIVVSDTGSGIDHSRVEELFGDLGESWKKNTREVKGRSLHGKNGEGRFKAFSLGGHVEWNTVYKTSGKTYAYSIVGKSESIEDIDVTPVRETSDKSTGTQVIITNISESFGELVTDDAIENLTKRFAVYLSKYNWVDVIYRGNTIDPTALQLHIANLPSKEITLQGGKKGSFDLTVIEWALKTPKLVHLCDHSGVSLLEIPAGVNAPHFHYTAYLKSERFRELDAEALLADELHPDRATIIEAAKKDLRSYFRKRKAEKFTPIVQRWKEQHIYPYEEKEEISSVEEAERQVFDILAVNVETYLPKYDTDDHKAKKFMFMLIAQALKQNPASVQKIITEVLSLTKSQQDDLAELIDATSLNSIIKTSKTITNRLDFLQALENLVTDSDTKKSLLERDQLHKILDTEAWIFDEEFNLAGSEERLEEVLEKHIGELGVREDGETAVEVGEGKTGRIDLRLSKAIEPKSGEHEYLVIELKRPSKKVDAEVLMQIEKYAMAVAKDDRFAGVPARWKFIAVSTTLDDYAQQKTNQPNRPTGLVWESSDSKITVWAREWAEVINTARARLEFMRKQLNYQADRESAKEYLHKTHSKYIPESVNDTENQDDADSAEDPLDGKQDQE